MRLKTSYHRLLVTLSSLIVSLFLLNGCATRPNDNDAENLTEFQENNDPFEPTNRKIFAFNDFFDTYLLYPSAVRYRDNIPEFVRNRISDFLANLKAPVVVTNDILEGNVSTASETTARFLLNTSFGVFGIMDVAEPMGIPKHEADLGETFAVWGSPDGPYLVLPFFGPSNMRDMVGIAVSSFADPLDQYLQINKLNYISYGRFALGGVSMRANYIDAIDDIKRTSLDYYSAMRSLYRQRRTAQIQNSINRISEPSVSLIHMVPKLNLNLYNF